MQRPAPGGFVVKEEVSKYYGQTLSCTADLKTSACCDATALPPRIAAALAKVHPDVVRKYYGCGLCLPPDDLSGLHVLDLGCGAGRDCFILSQLVGPTGHVTGIDMTEEQLMVCAYISHSIRLFFSSIFSSTGGAGVRRASCQSVRLRQEQRLLFQGRD